MIERKNIAKLTPLVNPCVQQITVSKNMGEADPYFAFGSRAGDGDFGDLVSLQGQGFELHDLCQKNRSRL